MEREDDVSGGSLRSSTAANKDCGGYAASVVVVQTVLESKEYICTISYEFNICAY